ncbi:S-adenosyl-l-methionine hydroxide adenosyltransferase family protein [Natrialbaceae archaeon A-arb3/5]
MITLASDFGTPYPAAMKGVLCQRTDAKLVDVSHEFPRQDVRAAAFWLRETLPYFPPAVHLVVVDPGVGTDRDALVVRAGEHALVGPDNGVLVPVARRLAGEEGFDTFVIDESRLDPPEQPTTGDSVTGHAADSAGPASNTFHGRDVFAPAAGDVHEAGVDSLTSLAFLEPTSEFVEQELPTATVEGDRATGEVLVVDDFGNAITNVPGRFLDGQTRIGVDGDTVPVGDTFAAVSVGERLATVGSHGYVELDVNQGRGDEAFGLSVGDRIVLDRSE